MVYRNFLSLFLKPNCPLCDRPADGVTCSYCERQLQRCRLKNPRQFWQGTLPVFAWGNYGGALKKAIAALKYENNPQLARPLGMWLGQTWNRAAIVRATQLVVVPIPMHPDKRRQRGFDQAQLLARSFARVTGLPLRSRGLVRVRQTEALFGLSPEARQQEVKEAFAIGPEFRRRSPGSVLLVDDIYTTGATTLEAAAVLKKCGIRTVGVVALATPRRPNGDR
ncbi:MAG: ComF family protein [Cyanobacteriota bacterium]|nr:ComF family protein [Cyanobacteriota bacterium]